MGGIPSVSVVVPTYNRAHVVTRAIESVRGQSMPDWELIVVDDASTNDDIASAVATIGDPRVRVVRRADNGGVAAAQNTGLDAARGRYVAFLHSDDEWVPERLAVLVPMLDAAGPDVGGVESGAWIIDPAHTRPVTPWLLHATDADLLAYRAGVHIASLLLRREIALAVRFDDALRHTEDRDFCIRLLRRTRLAFEPQPLVVVHREHAGLRDLDKTPTCEYLLTKYADDILPTPRLHASWMARLARLAARAGHAALARRSIREAARLNPRRPQWRALRLTSYLPDPIFVRVFAAYIGARERRQDRRERRASRQDARSAPVVTVAPPPAAARSGQ